MAPNENTENTEKPTTKSNTLYAVVWALLMVNLYLVFGLRHGFQLLNFLGFSAAALIGIAFVGLSGRPKRIIEDPVPIEVAEVVQDAMEGVRPHCEEIFLDQFHQVVGPMFYDAESHFRDGLAWLWQSAEGMREILQKGLIKSKLELGKMSGQFAMQGWAQIYNNTDGKLDKMLAGLNDLPKLKERNEADLQNLSARVLEDTQVKLEKEKDLMLNYLENLLTVQLSEEYQETGEVLQPSIEKLSAQFQGFLDRSLDAKIENLDETMAQELGTLASKIVGDIQGLTLNMVNGLDQNIDTLKRLMAEKKAEADLRERIDNLNILLVSLRDEANAVLFSLAWRDMMIDSQWQTLSARLEKDNMRMQQDAGEGVLNDYIDELKKAIPTIVDLGVSPAYRSIYNMLGAVEYWNNGFTWSETAEKTREAATLLFQYVLVIERMAERVIMVPMETLRNARLMRESVRQGAFAQEFARVRSEVQRRRPELDVYLQDVYPQQFLSFCSDHYMRPRPQNAGDGAWMLFFVLIYQNRFSKADSDSLYLMGLLLVAHNMRNRYVHPTRGKQVVSLEDPDRLIEIRMTALDAIELLGRMGTHT
ncbi:MAG: hypothetical protein ACM3QZ_02735 [Solirubrobacterales bacterium]